MSHPHPTMSNVSLMPLVLGSGFSGCFCRCGFIHTSPICHYKAIHTLPHPTHQFLLLRFCVISSSWIRFHLLHLSKPFPFFSLHLRFTFFMKVFLVNPSPGWPQLTESFFHVQPTPWLSLSMCWAALPNKWGRSHKQTIILLLFCPTPSLHMWHTFRAFSQLASKDWDPLFMGTWRY